LLVGPTVDLTKEGFELNLYGNEQGEPDLDLAGLKLWIHGYQYQNADDFWDGNWLTATAICSENGATVRVQGHFIRTDEIAEWGRSVEKLSVDLRGEAILESMEHAIELTLKVLSLGAIEMKVQITPDLSTQEHKFTFSIDQSYLGQFSSQCARLLLAFPIRGD
jgi:hypothetical protein